VPPVPGDFNLDHKVDGADYVLWRNNLNDGYTQADYAVWRSHFGMNNLGTGVGGAAAVPEPPGVVLTLTAAGMVLGNLRAIVGRKPLKSRQSSCDSPSVG
jgi:hypothetical protein